LKHLLFAISIVFTLGATAQQTTFTVKKKEEVSGLYYAKDKTSKTYSYILFSGNEVSVWKSPEKPKNTLSNTDYRTFAKANIKTTEYVLQDSLVTFVFKKQVKDRYTFLDYHCIIEKDKTLHVKISDTNEIIEVQRYKLVKK